MATRARGENPRVATFAEAEVVSVDPVRYTCSVLFMDTEQPAEGVSFYSAYKSGTGPGHSSSMPQERDVVLCIRLGQSWNVLAYKTLPRVEIAEDEEQVPTHDFSTPREDYSGGRPPQSPGDWVTATDVGGFLAVRADGAVEVVANEICATRWFPDEEAVRTFAATLENMGYWGVAQAYTVRDKAREEAGATPTGFRSWFRTHAEGAPVLNIEAGAVLDDERVRLPGREKRSTDTPGSVCFRLMVFDQATVNEFEEQNLPPNPERARFILRIDEEGNLQQVQAGQRTEAYSGMTRHNTGRHVERVEGGYRIEAQDFQLRAEETFGVSSDRGISMTTAGDFRIRCGRLLIEETNRNSVVEGDFRVDAGGTMSLRGGANLSLATGGDTIFTTGSDRADAVGGRYELDVLNRVSPENLGRDVAAYSAKIHGGKHRTVVTSGSWEVLVGPEQAPLARIKVFQNFANPSSLGKIHIGFPRGNLGLVLSPDGAFELRGASAGIKGGASGRVQLGDVRSPVVGKVVSTLSHPVCYVTGAPILGHDDVVVAYRGPLTPGPGIPSLGVVPGLPAFDPDPVRA